MRKTGTAPFLLQTRCKTPLMTIIKHKFLVMSSKGGVGKTSVLANLALSLAKKGMKVGLIFGWIENMRGFLCQHCGKSGELFSTGPGNRAVSLRNIPFLGRIPIDPHMVECAEAGDPFIDKHPESEVTEACNLIIEKIMGGERKW